MGKLKTGLLAVTGATIGVLTLRKLRNRGQKDEVTEEIEDAEAELDEAEEDIEEAKEDVEEAAKDAKDEAITAVKHVGGAVKHAGLATVKAIKSRGEKDDSVIPVTESADTETDAAESK